MADAAVANSEKGASLARLRAKVIDELCVRSWHDVWFFPRWNGVQGWCGTADVFFVGSAPNFGRFPTGADKFLYGDLLENEFENSHVTDLFKTRARNEDVGVLLRDADFVRRHQEYFRRELEILRPRLVVAFGDQTETELKKWQSQGIPIPRVKRMWHYAYPFRFNRERRISKQRQFSEQMTDVREEYDRLLARGG